MVAQVKEIVNNIVTAVIAFAVVYIFLDIYIFAQQGERFTYCDGIVHEVVEHGKDVDIPKECYDHRTGFSKYIYEKDPLQN